MARPWAGQWNQAAIARCTRKLIKAANKKKKNVSFLSDQYLNLENLEIHFVNLNSAWRGITSQKGLLGPAISELLN